MATCIVCKKKDITNEELNKCDEANTAGIYCRECLYNLLNKTEPVGFYYSTKYYIQRYLIDKI